MNLKKYKKTKKVTAWLAACALGLSAYGISPVCAAETESEAMEYFSVDGESVDSSFLEGTFVASDAAWPVQDSYEFPFIGLNMTLPDPLKQEMTDKTIAMLTSEDWNDDLTVLKYAFISFRQMTKEQSTAEVEKLGSGFEDWQNSLSMVGTIGIYDADSEKDLDTLTGCTEHTKLGTSSDGTYTYYLSLNKDADTTLTDELKEIQTTLTDITPSQQITAFGEPQTAASTDAGVGDFEMSDVDGTSYTQSLFGEYNLTLVNVFTTWCSPCVNEIPELQKLSEQMKDKGVGVVGIVLDTAPDGTQNEEAIQKAQMLREKTGASYPFLIPDASLMNGHLNAINAFPHTFFVNKNGTIVGDSYDGSHDLEEWTEIVTAQLDALKG